MKSGEIWQVIDEDDPEEEFQIMLIRLVDKSMGGFWIYKSRNSIEGSWGEYDDGAMASEWIYDNYFRVEE